VNTACSSYKLQSQRISSWARNQATIAYVPCRYSRQEQPSHERSVVHLRAAGTLARVLIGSMRRNGVIRQVTVVMRHHVMQLIASGKKPGGDDCRGHSQSI
jgi:hypothetical protein